MYKIIIIITVFIFISACAVVSKQSINNYEQGIKVWKDGKKEKAIELLETSIKESPAYYNAHIKLAEFYFETKKYDKAITSVKKAIELKSEAHGYILLGNIYLKQKKYQTAQYTFGLVLEQEKIKNKDKFEALLGKGIAKLELTLYEDSQDYIHKALKILPNSHKAKFYNALLKEKQMGANSYSIKIYEKLINDFPDYPAPFRQLGNIWQSLEQHSKAITYYEKYIKLEKDGEIETYIKEKKEEQANGLMTEPEKKDSKIRIVLSAMWSYV